MNKQYELSLPVFKQGDDLNAHLENHPNDPAAAFKDLSERYQCAADLCQRVAGRLSELDPKQVEVIGDTHFILITAPEEAMQGLVKDKVLSEPEWLEEEEEIDE